MTSVLVFERAIELARSGACTSVNDVRQRLRGEGYTDVVAGLAGATANRAIIDALKESVPQASGVHGNEASGRRTADPRIVTSTTITAATTT